MYYVFVLHRNVFTWRSNNNINGDSKENAENGNGWKFFNGTRVPPSPGSREESLCDSPPDHPASSSSGGSTPMHRRQGSNASAGSECKQFENLVASSIALIQHNRFDILFHCKFYHVLEILSYD